MQVQLDLAERLLRENDGASARAALDSLFHIGNEAGLVDEFFVYVLAYNYFCEKPEPILYAILEKNIELFPNSAKAYLTLAEVYYAAGKKELAIPHYEKVLELDPDNANVLKKLSELKVKK